jgi:hypothetical protein
MGSCPFDSGEDTKTKYYNSTENNLRNISVMA